MPGINAEVPHSLGRDAALERLRGFSAGIRDRYKDQISELEESWEGETLSFSFKSFGFKISGNLEVGEDSVKLKGNVPIAAMMFKGKIQQEFSDQLAKILS